MKKSESILAIFHKGCYLLYNTYNLGYFHFHISSSFILNFFHLIMAATTRSRASIYDVFLNFRGEDTRYGFTGNLYRALSDKGIRTFFDEEKLHSGEEITPALLKAIKDSRIAITVLSEDFASSSFCLDELTSIVHCAQYNGMMIIPVFYKVYPSDVRHQKGTYGEALAKHKIRFPEKLQNWEMALRQVADLSGFHFKYRYPMIPIFLCFNFYWIN